MTETSYWWYLIFGFWHSLFWGHTLTKLAIPLEFVRSTAGVQCWIFNNCHHWSIQLQCQLLKSIVVCAQYVYGLLSNIKIALYTTFQTPDSVYCWAHSWSMAHFCFAIDSFERWVHMLISVSWQEWSINSHSRIIFLDKNIFYLTSEVFLSFWWLNYFWHHCVVTTEPTACNCFGHLVTICFVFVWERVLLILELVRFACDCSTS